MSDDREARNVTDVGSLIAAGRGDRPRDGAKERALTMVRLECSGTPAMAAYRPPRASSTLAVGLASVLVAAVLFIGIFVKHQQETQAAAAAVAQQELAVQKAKTDALLRQFQLQARETAELEAAVANAKDDAARLRAQQRLHAAEDQRVEESKSMGDFGGVPRAGVGSARRSPPPDCNCARGDPLCSCIP